jgi:hypothetical protein
MSGQDERTCKLLESKARKLLACSVLLESGDCKERAEAAFEEAAAILRDAAAFLRRQPHIHPEREH